MPSLKHPRGVSSGYGGGKLPPPRFGGGKLPPRPKTTKPPPVRRAPAQPLYAGYLTPAQIRAQAVAEANAANAPTLAELRTLRAEELARARAQGRAVQGFTTTAASIAGQAAPAVSAAYGQAAGQTAAFAQGFSDATKHLATQNADTQNSWLAGLGNTSQSVNGQGAALGDVAYGLGGYIPGSTLAREGAAYTAQAAAYPRTMLGQGLIGFRQALAAGETAAKGYDQRMLTVARQKGTQISSLTRAERQRQATLAGQDLNRRIQQAQFAAQQAAQKRRDEQSLGVIESQNAKTANSQAQAWTKINGYLSGPDGAPIKGKNGQLIPTESARQSAETASRLQAQLEETQRHNAAGETLTGRSIEQRAEAARQRAAAAKVRAQNQAVAARGRAVGKRNKTQATVYKSVASDAKTIANIGKSSSGGGSAAAIAAILGSSAPGPTTQPWGYGKASAYLFNKYWPQLAPYSAGAAGTKQLQGALRKKIRSSLAIVGIRPKGK